MSLAPTLLSLVFLFLLAAEPSHQSDCWCSWNGKCHTHDYGAWSWNKFKLCLKSCCFECCAYTPGNGWWSCSSGSHWRTRSKCPNEKRSEEEEDRFVPFQMSLEVQEGTLLQLMLAAVLNSIYSTFTPT